MKDNVQMEKEATILTNIHLIKTAMAKYYNVEFKYIVFRKLNEELNSTLFESIDNLQQDFVGFQIHKNKLTHNVFNLNKAFFIEDTKVTDGETINDYIESNLIDIDDYSFFAKVTHNGKQVRNIVVLMNKTFHKLIKSEIKSLPFILCNVDVNIYQTHKIYFNSIQNIPTLN